MRKTCAISEPAQEPMNSNFQQNNKGYHTYPLLFFFQLVFNFCKIKWTHRLLPVSIKKISPPLQHQSALIKMLGFMNISRTHKVTPLMAHLPLDCISRPQPWLNQRTTLHCPETVTAHFNLCVISHHSQRFVHRILAHRFARIVIANKDQFMIATEDLNLLKN